jgi:MFS family permease
MLLTGLGVGLTLPTAFAVGAGTLPPQRFATGSGVLSMARQLGLALGVALLVALLGTPDTPAATLDAFQRAWYVTAAIAVVAGLIGFAVRSRSQAPHPIESPGHTPEATERSGDATVSA